MEEIKIDVPEGYEIDEQNSTFNLIKFKKIEQKYQYPKFNEIIIGDRYYPDNSGQTDRINASWSCGGVAPTKEIAQGIKAISELTFLYQDYITKFPLNSESAVDEYAVIWFYKGYIKIEEIHIEFKNYFTFNTLKEAEDFHTAYEELFDSLKKLMILFS